MGSQPHPATCEERHGGIRRPSVKAVGGVLGVALFAFALVAPLPSIAPDARATLAVTLLVATWWLTQAIPIPAASLVPLVLLPLLQVAPAKEVAKLYIDDALFLFLGGFILAIAIEEVGLHRRLARVVLRRLGGSTGRLSFGFLAVAAVASGWVSNTATALMLLPMALAVIAGVRDVVAAEAAEAEQGVAEPSLVAFQALLLLSVAYGASIGGIATKIGTPPNIVFLKVAGDQPAVPEIDFLTWMVAMVPLAVAFLPLAWLVLARFVFPCRELDAVLAHGRGTGIESSPPWSRDEKLVAAVFVATAAFWIFRSDIDLGGLTLAGWSTWAGLGGFPSDSTVAIFASMLLFLLPSAREGRERILDWSIEPRIPWGVLLLFGGGFAIAGTFESSGLSTWLGERFAAVLPSEPWMAAGSTALAVTFLTEVTSNTATSTVFLPILAGVEQAAGLPPLLLLLPATIAASCAFMLPVATPPNAIVFGSGRVTIGQMARAGIVLNLLGVVLITIFALTWWPWVLG